MKIPRVGKLISQKFVEMLPYFVKRAYWVYIIVARI